MSMILTGLLARFGTYIALGAGLLVAFFAWQKRIEVKAVENERQRIETKSREIDAKASNSRRAAERQPDLKQYYRD